MPRESSIQMLRVARDKLADVFHNEVTDDVYDNGLLGMLVAGVSAIEDSIRELEKRS